MVPARILSTLKLEERRCEPSVSPWAGAQPSSDGVQLGGVELGVLKSVSALTGTSVSNPLSSAIVSSAACAGSRRRPTTSGLGRSTTRRHAAPSSAAGPEARPNADVPRLSRGWNPHIEKAIRLDPHDPNMTTLYWALGRRGRQAHRCHRPSRHVASAEGFAGNSAGRALSRTHPGLPAARAVIAANDQVL